MNSSCDDYQNLLFDYVDGSLNAERRGGLDEHLSGCEDCQATLQQIWHMQAAASRWQDQSVPNWARRKTFFESSWMSPGVHWLSAFASGLALVLVLGQANISTKDGFSIRFGGDYMTRDEFTASLEEASTKQTDLLQTAVSGLNERQIATNQLLMKTMLDISREERRNDLDTILTAWDYAQTQQASQTNESLRVLAQSQVEDRRNLEQINRLLRTAALEGNNL